MQGGLYGLGLMLFGFALAQPQCGSKSELMKRKGIDVVVVLDASKSMLARDVQPSRLERAKLELSTLLDELKGDRVGLVVFAGDAFIQSPLTSDYSAVKLFLRAVDPEQMPQGGSNIGAALKLSKQVLDNADRGAKERVIVLLSDGEDLFGEVNEAVDALKDGNVQVLAIGVGSEGGEPIPIFNRRGEFVDYKKDTNGETVITRLDSAGLTAIAEATGGEFFYQPRGVAMGAGGGAHRQDAEERAREPRDHALQRALPGVRRGGPGAARGGDAAAALAQEAVMSRGLFMRALAWVLVVGLSAPAWAAGPLEVDHPLVAKGRAAYDAKDYEGALAAFEEAKKERPEDPAVEYNRGVALAQLGRVAEAKQAFQRVAEANRPELQEKAWYNLGNVHATTGERKEALQAYRRALKLDPE